MEKVERVRRLHLESLSLWLLPFLALRLLLPAGFMPVASAEGLNLAFCVGGFAVDSDASKAPQSRDHADPCPFGVNASAASATVALSLPDAPVTLDTSGVHGPLTPLASAERHAHAPRAPPRSARA